MNFFLLGIDHNTAGVEIREAAYRERGRIADFWTGRAACRAAILSTCGRLEIYGAADNAFEAEAAVDAFKECFGECFAKSRVIYGEGRVFRHLTRLSAGLESQIKGEPQIFDQLADWSAREDFPAALGRLARQALLAGLKIRARAGLNRPENNIAALLYKDLLEKNLSDDLLNIAVAGTGKIAELFARDRPEGVRLYFAAHKNIVKARELAGISMGTALLLKDLPELLLDADVLISASSSPHTVFDKDYFSKIAALRDRELYIYDLAMPRDVDPDVKNLDGIVLKNIDEAVSYDPNVKSRHAAEQISR